MAKNILIVENESIIALDEKQILEAEGYTCSIVFSGEKAIEIMNSKKKIDLVLMDIDLGSGIDGTEAAEIILRDFDLPIVFISSHIEPEIVKKTAKITSYGYIVKDSGPTVLIASLQMAFRLFEANRQIINQKKSLEVSQFCLDNVSIGIFMLDTEGTITYLNNFAAANIGYHKEEIIGRSISIIDKSARPMDWHYNDDDLNRFFIFETNHIRKDGSLLPVEVSANNVLFGDNIIIFALVKDLTQKREQEKLLESNRADIQTSRAKLKNVMELAHMGGWELDVEKNMFTFTDELFSLLHTTAEEQGGYQLTPKQYSERFMHPEDSEIVAFETRQAIETDDPDFSKQINHRIIYADGGEGYITVRFFIVKNENGKTIKTYGANQDITEIKKNEERIESLLKEKELLLQEIQHRVKNNMRTIEGLISLQLAGVRDENARATLNEARQRISIMMNIYKNLSSRDNYHSVNGKIILLETLSGIALSYDLDKHISLETDIEDVSLIVSVAINICIIINELVTNAYKYAFSRLRQDDKGIVKVSVFQENGGLTIIVDDNGIGMPAEVINNNGFGLGLSLVKSMIENNEGTLDILTKGKNGTKNENGTKITIHLNKLTY
ncbi:MAG: PAS domain S-box protein [Spirochaetales bacterium]|nr:PAS domain S-box protein [Spirochaetales bacterium]